MRNFKVKKLYVAFIFLIGFNGLCADCKKTFGGSYRKSSSSRTYSRAVPTSKSHVNPTISSRNYNTQGSYHNSNNYNQRKAVQVTTPRYVIRTQPTIRQYHQPVYNQKPLYNQQPSYPRQSYPQQQQQHYPQQNYPTFRPNVYQPSYTGNNYGSGGFYKHKDHSTRNAVLAGLGGSALGMYLGYKLGGLTNSLSNPYSGGYGGYGGNGGFNNAAGMPQYTVVHHYHHGDRPIIQNAVVESNVITPCKDISFCMNSTTPLCMTNGTVYCVTPIDQTSICNVNSTTLTCVNTTISAPCLDVTNGSCNSTTFTTENLQIPCVSSINVFGDFTTNKLSVHNANGSPGQNTLSNQGISNKYCVTVIAEPFVEPKELSNADYASYLKDNPVEKEEANAKIGNIMNSIAGFMFF